MSYTYDTSDEHAYDKAKKLASRAYHAALQKDENPYLPVLEELLPEHLSLPHIHLGLVTIPMNQLVGTATRARTSAFACNFMPLLDEGSEFAQKWVLLHHSVIQDGVREPIKVLEYMNRFYAVEGNKRISVMKFLGSPLVEAEVTRILPKRTGDLENRIYFEFLDFYKDTGINYIGFTEEGGFTRLCEMLGHEPGVKWSADDLADFQASFMRFSKVYEVVGGDLLKITPGDAFLIYLEVYGYHKEHFFVESQVRANLNRLRNEFRAKDHDESFSLMMNTEGQKPGLIHQILHPAQKMKVAFVYDRSPQTSGWAYWHELGKNHVETAFGSKVETTTVSDVGQDDCQRVLEELIEQHSNIIFTTSPTLLSGAMKTAIQHPEVKILNCSLLPSYHAVRSYYLRMYEAKFIIGAIAGAVSSNNKIGYIADYPVYGTPANINAFALGARLTNPRAEIYLDWSTLKDSDPIENFRSRDVWVINNRDISAPSHQSKEFGLYTCRNGESQSLAMPVWNWGRLYEDLLKRVQNGIWRTDATHNGVQALNYWWGMNTGAIDVFYSLKLDSGTRRLVDLLRRQIRSGALLPFAESIVSQDGETRCMSGKALTPAEIIAMDWLTENVIGDIPPTEKLRREALPFVELQGLNSIKPPDTSEICWTDPCGAED